METKTNKQCTNCGKLLGKPNNAELHNPVNKKYCNRGCKRIARNRVSKQYRYHRKSSCELCPETNCLTVHHKDGNVLNNHPNNLMTLCQYCHFVVESPKSERIWKIYSRFLTTQNASTVGAKFNPLNNIQVRFFQYISRVIGRLKENS